MNRGPYKPVNLRLLEVRAAIILALAALIFAGVYLNGYFASLEKKQQRARMEWCEGGTAQAMAQEEVRRRMRTPSVARFHDVQASYYSGTLFTDTNGHTRNDEIPACVVLGQVDSQNAYGAMLNTTFKIGWKYGIALKYGGNEWVPVSYFFSNPDF